MGHIRWIAIVLAAALVAVAASATVWQFMDRQNAPTIIIRDPPSPATIVVAVAGAVGTPGIYSLPGIARVADALEAAGGVNKDADLTAVNLAERLEDEAQIVVPTLAAAGAAYVDAAPTSQAVSRASAMGVTNTQTRIDINSASAGQLEALPGIGPALAAAIVVDRQANGRYGTVDELARVAGISDRMVEELRSFIRV